MKRILCLLVIIALVLAISSCQEKEEKIGCEECGISILKSSNYCSNCGSKVFEDENTPNPEDKEKRFVGSYKGHTPQEFHDFGTSGKHYMSNNIPINEKMVLYEDGTGTYERRFANEVITYHYLEYYVDKYDLEANAIHSTYNLEWEVVDGYVIIQFSGYNYYPNYPRSNFYETKYVSDGELDEFSRTYELRANKLFDIDKTGDTAQFTKID